MIFDTGDVGENLVQLWASQAGITANPVRRDKEGWDFCLQFRHKPKSIDAPALESVPAELTCFVQVKATRGYPDKSESISLANWLRMATAPFPWFVLRVALDEEGEPNGARLVHVDAVWIERVLRRVRELASVGITDLRGRTLEVTWDDDHAVSVPYPAALSQQLRRHVDRMDTYFQSKLNTIRTVGYDEKSRFTVSFRFDIFSTPEGIERGVDFAIGLQKSLPVASFTMRDLRFGIPQVLKDGEGSGDIQLPRLPSAGKTRVGFAHRPECPSLWLDFETYVPGWLFPRLEDRYFKARLVHRLVTLIWQREDARSSFRLHVPDAEPLTLRELAQTHALLRLLEETNSANPLIGHYRGKEGRDVPMFEMTDFDLSPVMKELRVLAGHVLDLARFFGLPDDLSLLAPKLHDQATQLSLMSALLDRRGGELKFGAVLDADPSIGGKEVAFVIPASTLVGDQVIAMVVAYSGPAEWTDEGYVMVTNGDVRILDKRVIGKDAWLRGENRTRAGEFAAQLDASGEYAIVSAPPEDDVDETSTGADDAATRAGGNWHSTA